MICPKCKEPIDVSEQLKFADEHFYEGVQPPIILMIDCHNCRQQTCGIEIFEVDGFDEMESPALGGKKVLLAKPKK